MLAGQAGHASIGQNGTLLSSHDPASQHGQTRQRRTSDDKPRTEERLQLGQRRKERTLPGLI